MNNGKIGNDFELEVLKIFGEMGFFCFLIPKRASGSQPADIQASRNNETYMIECKTLNNTTGKFPLTRIEENQRLSMRKWIECGNCQKNFCLFIKWNNGIHCVSSHNVLMRIHNNEKYINLRIDVFTRSVEEYLQC